MEEKDAFKCRIFKVHDSLTPPGSNKPIDNLSLMSELFDMVEARTGERESEGTVLNRSTMSFLRDSGKFA